MFKQNLADVEDLINNGEFKTIGFQYTLMYMARLFSQADFLAHKIMKLTGTVFSRYEVQQVFEQTLVN